MRGRKEESQRDFQGQMASPVQSTPSGKQVKKCSETTQQDFQKAKEEAIHSLELEWNPTLGRAGGWVSPGLVSGGCWQRYGPCHGSSPAVGADS